jgi:hypothetical protein
MPLQRRVILRTVLFRCSFQQNDPATPATLEQAKNIFDGLQHGTIDRSLFSDNANAYFSEQALQDFASGLAPLGTPNSSRRFDKDCVVA